MTSKFALSADFDDVAKTSNSGGLLTYKWGNGKWGGTCCKASVDICKDKNTVNQCNDDAATKIKLFTTNSVKQIAHSFYNLGGKKFNAMTGLKMAKAMDMPTAHMTTVRGRGALGSSNQKLVDVFWQMTSSISSSPAIMALLHFYVITKAETTDVNMNVVYGFPLNTYVGNADKAKKFLGNDGANALSVGLKVYVVKDKAPLANYYGFFVPRMTPFFKSTGGNEIEVRVSNPKRTVQCWAWGSYNGNGFALTHTFIGNEFFVNKYFALMQYKGLNMVICKLGTAKADKDTGDVVVIPATQSGPIVDNVNNPLP